MPILFKEAEVCGHSLGINLLEAKRSKKKSDKKLPDNFYRNRFCAGFGHENTPELKSLETMGYMAQRRKINEGQDTLWCVTNDGIKWFREYFQYFIES